MGLLQMLQVVLCGQCLVEGCIQLIHIRRVCQDWAIGGLQVIRSPQQHQSQRQGIQHQAAYHTIDSVLGQARFLTEEVDDRHSSMPKARLTAVYSAKMCWNTFASPEATASCMMALARSGSNGGPPAWCAPSCITAFLLLKQGPFKLRCHISFHCTDKVKACLARQITVVHRLLQHW